MVGVGHACSTPGPPSRDASGPRVPVLAALLVLLLGFVPLNGPTALAESHGILRVGAPDEMKTRNPLPAIANDVWTADVLFRVYDSVMLTHPTLARPLAFIAKGTDFDEDGMFSPATEYDKWAERPGATTPLEITIYYDFNGVRWHDGVQMTPWDLFFSYHMNAMNPRFNTDLRVLYTDVNGQGQPVYEPNRRLGIVPTTKNWEGEGTMAGDPNLRVAVRYTLNGPFTLLYESTLAPVMMPMHIWSRTGGGRHTDFGCAVWIPDTEAAAQGISSCGTTDTRKWGRGIASSEFLRGSKPYVYSAAEQWVPTDPDVIGHGPFKFRTWIPGVEAKVVRNEDFYTGVDRDGTVLDARLAELVRGPTIAEIRFVMFRTPQLGVFALQSGEIDFLRWVPPEFVPDLLKNPNIAVEANAQNRVYFMGYNFRREPWGYDRQNQSSDIGYELREAISHLVDRKSIVEDLLQNLGVPAFGFISPANTFWYNGNIPKPAYDLALANAILDDPLKGGLVPIGPDPPGACLKDTPSGCRSLPRIGNAAFEILTPQADFDPVRASAGGMIASAMREVGLNAVSKPVPYGEIVQRVLDSHDYDMYILGYGGRDPDWLFYVFSCGGPAPDYNWFGHCDPELDDALRVSHEEWDRNRRRDFIFRAQEILAEDRPAEPLFFRTNIEAYRGDRFQGWVVADGRVWNYWSLIYLRSTETPLLRLGIDADTSAPSEGTTTVRFIARDASARPVSGANLRVTISSPTGEDPGALVNAGEKNTALDLRTDIAGRAAAAYIAPLLYESTRPVLLRAIATHPDYDQEAREETLITVVGRNLSFLSVRIDLPAGDLVDPGSPLPVRIEVRDQWGVVPDASVEVRAYPSGEVSFAVASSEGLRTAFAAFPSPGLYSLGVNATRDGYRPAWGFVRVWVSEPSTSQRPGIPSGNRGEAAGFLPVWLGLLPSIALAWVAAWRLMARGRERPKSPQK